MAYLIGWLFVLFFGGFLLFILGVYVIGGLATALCGLAAALGTFGRFLKALFRGDFRDA